jgi:hypothetical protein
MKHLAVASLVGLLLAFAFVGPAVRGQTPAAGTATATTTTATASPTSTPVTATPVASATTVTPPDATTLLNAATTAYNNAGSGHVKLKLDESVGGKQPVKLTANFDGDAAWKKPEMAKFTGTIGLSAGNGLPGTIQLALQLRYAKNRIARRATDTNGKLSKWSCESVNQLLKSTGTSTTPAPAPTLIPGVPQPKIKSTPPVDLGPDTIDGIAVWHVQQTTTETLKVKKKTDKATYVEDIYVSQSDSSLVEVKLTGTDKTTKPATTITLAVDLSNYGEAVKVTLPAACSKKKDSAVVARVLRYLPAALLAQPRLLLQPLPATISNLR